MIDPQDVIRRYTVEDLIQTAEEYYRRVDDPSPLMSKPFTFLHEAPEMLQNLGFLLAGLQLGKTMKVLDFGGGTGWLSRFLTQLNCQAICCDASATALEIGRRLCRDYPLIGTVAYQPRFLPFDGHRIDLPDESVDRIICFDAFHHVPNQAEVLREFGRVLKTGGIAGFSEPGRQHSRSPQSQYEMQNHRVLENDIDVNAIFAHASGAGFTRLSLRAATDMELSLDEQNVLFAPPHGEPHERLKAEIWNQTYNTMTMRAVFFLHKGPLTRDSRSHIGLAHTLTARQGAFSGPAGTPIAMPFTIANTGEATWLHTNDEIFGIVRLGAHLYDHADTLLSIDFFRQDLPVSVRPGERVDVTALVTMPDAGRYRLGFDLVAEGVTWFENVGSTPVYVDVVAS
jgi:SAM-dependent methyltransferase